MCGVFCDDRFVYFSSEAVCLHCASVYVPFIAFLAYASIIKLHKYAKFKGDRLFLRGNIYTPHLVISITRYIAEFEPTLRNQSCDSRIMRAFNVGLCVKNL
jgi:hypothetical protein